MGYYVETPVPFDKAHQLIQMGARPFQGQFYDDIPEGEVAIVVLDNGWMEAAGIAYNRNEFEQFTDPTDTRPRRIVTVPREVAITLNPSVEPYLA